MRNKITLFQDQYELYKELKSTNLLVAFVEFMFEDKQPKNSLLNSLETAIFNSFVDRMEKSKKLYDRNSKWGQSSHWWWRPEIPVEKPTEKTAKRAISLHTIKQLKVLDCSHYPSECFARDMFLFSFYTRGMSFIDIAYLQKKNLKGDMLFYRRRKTNQQLAIHWEPCMQEIMKNYLSDPSSPYLFSIIKESDNDPQKQYKNAQFLINRHLKNIGKRLGLCLPLTMYCARHSWASIAYNEGIPLSVISEGMGHDSEKTTRIYLTSLKTEVVDNANRKILGLL